MIDTIVAIVTIIAAVWVYNDATKNKNKYAILWALATLLFVPTILIYIVVNYWKDRTEP